MFTRLKIVILASALVVLTVAVSKARVPRPVHYDNFTSNFFFGGRFSHPCLRSGIFRWNYRNQFRQRGCVRNSALGAWLEQWHRNYS
jgi:hypothetical protein